MERTESGIWVPSGQTTVFVKPNERILSQRKLEGMQRLAEIKQWGLRNPTKYMERFMGVELLDSQNYVFNASWDKMYALWLCSRNYGKALALDTPIPTPNGYRTMEDLEVGDMVFGDNGKPVKVLNTSEVFYNHRCYKLVFSDGEEIVADANHLWSVFNISNRQTQIKTTESMFSNHRLSSGRNKDAIAKYRIPLSPLGKIMFTDKYKSIEKIVEVESVPTKCIIVDNKSHLFLCGKKHTITHNSTILGLYYMTRGMLLNNCRSYICAGTSDQSIETFEKIVSIAKREVESFTGLTDMFANEVVVNQSNTDGFIRNPSGFYYRLYNGSFVKTINSNLNAKRGFFKQKQIYYMNKRKGKYNE